MLYIAINYSKVGGALAPRAYFVYGVLPLILF